MTVGNKVLQHNCKQVEEFAITKSIDLNTPSWHILLIDHFLLVWLTTATLKQVWRINQAVNNGYELLYQDKCFNARRPPSALIKQRA